MIHQPAVVVLTGLPGTGKYTVGLAVERLLRSGGAEVRLVDNHYVNNPIFGLIPEDGVTPLPAGVWDRVGDLHRLIQRTIDELSPRSWSFIFTGDVRDHPDDLAWVEGLAALAQRRQSTFLPVRLICELEELCRRVATPTRRERLKSIDPDEIRTRYRRGLPALEGWDPYTLDVTTLAPEDAARLIVERVATPR